MFDGHFIENVYRELNKKDDEKFKWKHEDGIARALTLALARNLTRTCTRCNDCTKLHYTLLCCVLCALVTELCATVLVNSSCQRKLFCHSALQ